MDFASLSNDEIKQYFGYNKEDIVEPVDLASKLGINITKTSLDQMQDGFKIVSAIVNNGVPTIFYHNMLVDGCGSDRVVLTYALIHAMLHGFSNLMITSKTIMTEQEETLIYDLLLPELQVRNCIQQGYSINKISQHFNVPKKCVRERIDAMPIVNATKI